LDAAAVGQFEGDDDDISSSGPGLGSVGERAVADGVNGLAAVGVAARSFVPILAEMILLAKIEGVVPVVLRIAGLREEVFLAYGIGESSGGLRRIAAGGAGGCCCDKKESENVKGSGQCVFPFPAGQSFTLR